MTPVAEAQQHPLMLPDDEFNRELIRQTHPPQWKNPEPEKGRYNLVTIGAGAAGLTAAAGCAVIGGRSALIERHLTGGDCLVAGCVPSKGLISASRVAALIRDAAEYGIRVEGSTVDFGAVMARMRKLRAQISPADSVAHLAGYGVQVFLGGGRFTGPDTIEVEGKTLRFARAVIATGGRAAVPQVPGLKEAGYLTNETVFQLTELPRRLVIIGAGPIGCELAQAFRRFGAEVTLIHNAGHILNREDGDAAEIVQNIFLKEGITLVLNGKTQRVDKQGADKVVVVEQNGKLAQIPCDAILVSAGRAPNVDGLNLEAAGVAYDKTGVKVDDFLQTSNPRIYAAGDIASPFKFTHTASAYGRIAMTNALFLDLLPLRSFRSRASRLVIPWCTFTEPEIAHVGLYEHQAKEKGFDVKTITVPFRENDRAVLDGEDNGFIRVHLKAGTGTILGATIVAARAGDFLSYFTLAMTSGKGLSSLANAIYPYPTQSELIKKTANAYLSAKLSPRVKGIMGRVLSWRR